MATFIRKRKPPDGKAPTWYKGCLRLDFEFRCAYCLIHEADYQSPEDFEVDHFEPKSVNPARTKEYANLYCTCRLCNKRSRKGNNWPSPQEVKRGMRFVDPCAEDWEDHVEFREDGRVRPLTKAGGYSVRIIDLDREYLRIHRMKFPGEYSNRSYLRRIERVVDRMSRHRKLPRALRKQMDILKCEVPRLRKAVAKAWNAKQPKPPEPHCPY